jgi:hypothetical protein
MTIVRQENKDLYKLAENFPTQKGAKTITINTKTHCLYLPVAEFETAPAATKDNPNPKPPVKSNSFSILEIKPL